MESVLEILIWAVIVMIVFFIANTVCCIRTAGSLFLSFLVASLVIIFIYQSIFGDIVLILTGVIGMIYAIFRSVRDKRDDAAASKTGSISSSDGIAGSRIY